MKRVIMAFLMAFSVFAMAGTVPKLTQERPLFVIKDADGNVIPGLSKSVNVSNAIEKALNYKYDAEYYIEMEGPVHLKGEYVDDGTGSGGGTNPGPNPDPNPVSCTMTISPGENIQAAIDTLLTGETLCLNDGKYTQAVSIPSGVTLAAVNIGMAEIDGEKTYTTGPYEGVVSLKGDNSSAIGIKSHDAPATSNACYVSGNNNHLKYMSCSHGGSYKHAIPMKLTGSNNLIEDSWFYGEGRYVVQCMQGLYNVIRRNTIRWDKTIAGEPGEPNASMSNYSCNFTIWENNISLDYAVPETEMIHCGDICMSTTTAANPEDPTKQAGGGNIGVQYLGNIVVNHSPGTKNNKGFRADQKGQALSSDLTIKDFFVANADYAIVINPAYTLVTVGNCTNHNALLGDGVYTNQQPIACNGDADISVRYENGVKTASPLFPFDYENLIKRDMCDPAERQSDWCGTDKNLTDYILNF